MNNAKANPILQGRRAISMAFPKKAAAAAAKRTASSHTTASALEVQSIRSRYQFKENVTKVQRTRHYEAEAEEEEEEFGAGGSEYELDGFVINDDDEEEEDDEQPDSLGFMPVRQGGSKKRFSGQKKKKMGKPITGDPELEGYDSYALDIMERFVADAKKLRQKIMERKQLERIESVFTDKVLRTIGLRLPRSNYPPPPFPVHIMIPKNR